MANKLRKLRKRELLELLVAQGKELESRGEQLDSAEKQIAGLQKQISGLEGRLIKLGASVRKMQRGDTDARTEAAMAQKRDQAAEKEKPEEGGTQQPSESKDQ